MQVLAGLLCHDFLVQNAWLVIFRCFALVVKMGFAADVTISDLIGSFSCVWPEFVDKAVWGVLGVFGVVGVDA
jgi:hypothetical protein